MLIWIGNLVWEQDTFRSSTKDMHEERFTPDVIRTSGGKPRTSWDFLSILWQELILSLNFLSLRSTMIYPLRMSDPRQFLNTVNHSFWFNERLLFTLHSMLVQKQWFHILKLVLQLPFWLLLEKCTHKILWLSEGCCQWVVIFSSPIMMELHKECSTWCCISLLPCLSFHTTSSLLFFILFVYFCDLTRVWEAQYTGE